MFGFVGKRVWGLGWFLIWGLGFGFVGGFDDSMVPRLKGEFGVWSYFPLGCFWSLVVSFRCFSSDCSG